MSGASVERGYVKNITQEGIRVESITRPGIVTPPMELLEVMEDPQPGDMVYYYMFSDGKCRILAVKPQQSGGGVTEHGKLTGREANNQHPIRAITGLQQKLETIPTKVSQLQNDEHFAKEDEVPEKTSDLENDSGFITPNDVKNGLADIDRAAFGTDDAEEKQLKIPADWDFYRGSDTLVADLLTSTDAGRALSANQGNVLKGLIDALTKIHLKNGIHAASEYPSTYEEGISIYSCQGSSDTGGWPSIYGIVVTFRPHDNWGNRIVQLNINNDGIYVRRSSGASSWYTWYKYTGTAV